MIRFVLRFLIIILWVGISVQGFAASTHHAKKTHAHHTPHVKHKTNSHAVPSHKKSKKSHKSHITHEHHASHKHRLPQVYDDSPLDNDNVDNVSDNLNSGDINLNNKINSTSTTKTPQAALAAALNNVTPMNTGVAAQLTPKNSPSEKSATTTESRETTSSYRQHFTGAVSVSRHLVDFVRKTVNTFHYSAYRLGGKLFDTKKGVYIVDCSGFVDKILQNACPKAYSSLVDATGANAPASQHYYHFFNELSYDPDSYWNKVENVDQLRAGDILVIRYKNSHGTETGGHVMVVMDKPERDTDVFYVRVADSAPTRHSDDTREYNTSGIGIGTLLLKANSRTGQPMAYAWGIGGYWNKNANFAMARPVDVG